MKEELLRDKLQVIAGDELLIDAVKTVFARRIELEKPEVKDDDDNVLLGEKYRAYEKAKSILNLAIIDITDYKGVSKKSNNFHKER